MVLKLFIYLFFVNLASARLIDLVETAFDHQLYEDVLDTEECRRQTAFIRQNLILTLQFADAGIRVPRALLQGNTVDLGNYHQCLGINHNLEDMHIQGKYCAIQVPINQTFHLPEDLPFTDWTQLIRLKDNDDLMRIMGEYDRIQTQIRIITGIDDEMRTLPPGPLSGTVLRLAVCIPTPCTTQQAMTSFIFNLTTIGFEYEDVYCRLPNDKPWVAADYIAVAVFSLIRLLTIFSTFYDIYYTFYIKIDRKLLNVLYTSFSMYTNGKRMMHFPTGPGNLQCLDGMRSLAMAWVILGHTFSTYKLYINGIDAFRWFTSLGALWITSGTITVDTFFTIAGVLLVYTTAGKMDGMKLLKNLHLFYLNRLLRMFPLLATAVLLQASYFNRISDGPTWITVSEQTNKCRTNWWTTLLHVQNLLNPRNLCINHSWYVAIDVQCYILSPVVLFWLLNGKGKSAWSALILSVLAVISASAIYNFINDFQSATVATSRPNHELIRYMDNYYYFTLTRAAPFFVGMLFGYVLHLYRNEKVHMSRHLAIFMWVCSLGVTTTIFFHTYFIKQFDWDNQLADNLINSFIRPAWGTALCWIIFACAHGYGGPINWFLTLDVWKLPSRLSYAMYLFHYPIMFIINDSTTSTNYFSVPWLSFQFLAFFTLSFIIAYIVTLLIELPFSIIFKKLLTPTAKPKHTPGLNKQLHEDEENAVSKHNNSSDIGLLNANNTNEYNGENETNTRLNGVIYTNTEGDEEVESNEKDHINAKADTQDKINEVIDDTRNKTDNTESITSDKIQMSSNSNNEVENHNNSGSENK